MTALNIYLYQKNENINKLTENIKKENNSRTKYQKYYEKIKELNQDLLALNLKNKELVDQSQDLTNSLVKTEEEINKYE